MVDNVTIIQEDRDAAAAYGEAIRDLSPGQVAQVLAGMWDDLPRVRWFAENRARLSSAPEGVDARELPPFKQAWAKKYAAGYRYGGHALENVAFGYEIARQELKAFSRPPAEGPTMADPIQTARIVEAMARHLEPQAWAALGAGDSLAYRSRRTSSLRKAQAALSTAYPMIREEMAKVADEQASDASDADNEYDGGAGACGYRMGCSASATAIRATELAKGEAGQEGEG